MPCCGDMVCHRTNAAYTILPLVLLLLLMLSVFVLLYWLSF